jgi:hypothetical protein
MCTNVESSSALVKRDTRLGEEGEPHPITDLDTRARRRHNEEERENYGKRAGLKLEGNGA